MKSLLIFCLGTFTGISLCVSAAKCFLAGEQYAKSNDSKNCSVENDDAE